MYSEVILYVTCIGFNTPFRCGLSRDMAYCSPVLLHRRALFIFFGLAAQLEAILIPRPGMEPAASAVGALSSYRRTARGSPGLTLTLTPDPNRWVWWPPNPHSRSVLLARQEPLKGAANVLGLALAGHRVPVCGPGSPSRPPWLGRLLLLLAGR